MMAVVLMVIFQQLILLHRGRKSARACGEISHQCGQDRRNTTNTIQKKRSWYRVKILVATASLLVRRNPENPNKMGYQAVALLAEMPTRRVTPDVVCFGAAIAALGEVAGTQNKSSWGKKVPVENQVGERERRWLSFRKVVVPSDFGISGW